MQTGAIRRLVRSWYAKLTAARCPRCRAPTPEQDAAAPWAVYSGGKKASAQAHRKWLRSVKFDEASDHVVLSDYLLAIEQKEQRIHGPALPRLP